MISNLLAHVTSVEAPAGLLLFAAGIALGFLAAQTLSYVRNR